MNRMNVYCNNCGISTAATKLHKLSKPCAPPTAYGKATLAAVHAGKLPPNMHAWPSEA